MSETPIIMTPFPVAEQQAHGESVFPMAYECQTPEKGLDAVQAWVRAHRDECIAQAAQHGAVLFRGLPLKTAEDFDAFVSAFDWPAFTYDNSMSNAVRINHTPRVFSANEAPPEATINLHHEMAQTPIYPRKLFFFCRQASEVGGATSICRSDILWDQLVEKRPEFANACAEKGLMYTHTMPSEEDHESGMGRSWRSTLSVETREEAEARLTELQYTWEWQDNGCLRVSTPALPAIRTLEDGRTSFFNQLIAAFTGWKDTRNAPSKALTFGDGSPMDDEGAQLASDLAEELIFDVPWQSGDVTLIDNYVVMHGRRTFEGKRSVLAAFLA